VQFAGVGGCRAAPGNGEAGLLNGRMSAQHGRVASSAIRVSDLNRLMMRCMPIVVPTARQQNAQGFAQPAAARVRGYCPEPMNA